MISLADAHAQLRQSILDYDQSYEYSNHVIGQPVFAGMIGITMKACIFSL